MENINCFGISCDYFFEIAFLCSSIIFTWLYFAIFESSAKQSTFGKRICKIVVTDMNGKRISFWRATWRFFVKILLTCFTFGLFGVIDVIFFLSNDKNRSLHDILAGTVVIKKPSA